MKRLIVAFLLLLITGAAAFVGRFSGAYIYSGELPSMMLYMDGTGEDANGELKWKPTGWSSISIDTSKGKIPCWLVDEKLVTMGFDEENQKITAVLIGIKL